MLLVNGKVLMVQVCHRGLQTMSIIHVFERPYTGYLASLADPQFAEGGGGGRREGGSVASTEDEPITEVWGCSHQWGPWADKSL